VQKVDDAARFSVTDEGIGLSSEDIPKLFKPFPDIRKPGHYEGTGLGLSICKGIVELHGGEMWAESPGMGRGSTFNFIIPDSSLSE
jgi:signal transduction histidine kinase